MAARSSVAGWAGAIFESLHNRDYRVLWIGSAFSSIAFMMSSTAQNVVAFDLTGTNHAVGTVQFGQGVAMLALAPFAGALADRLSKRLVLLLSQTAIGLTLLALGVLLYTGAISIFFLAAGAFLMGTMFAFLGPARQAYVADLVAPERRGNAVALSQVALNAARVLGPFLAGGLMAWGPVGPGGTYLVMAALFVFVVVTLVQLPPTRGRVRGQGPGLREDIVLGFRYVAHHPRLRLLLAGFVFVVMAGFPYMTVLPGFVKQELGASTAGFGLLLGISAAGGLLVSLVFASFADSPRAPMLLSASGIGFAVALVLTGLAPSFILAAATMFCVGAASSGFQTLNNALVIHQSDPAYYGRVMSLTQLGFSTSALVALPVGLYADAVGERVALMTMGAGVGAVAIVMALLQARVSMAPAVSLDRAQARRGLAERQRAAAAPLAPSAPTQAPVAVEEPPAHPPA